VAWGNIDGEGLLDFYLSVASTAPNKLFYNVTTEGNHWLQVRLRGASSNRLGIGARVKVVTGGVTQVREISGGSGFLSQDAPVASFGLGSATTIDSVIVCWPSGAVQIVSPAPAPDAAITLAEGVDPTPVQLPQLPTPPTTFRLHAPVPNPFSRSTLIRFDLPEPGSVHLAVYDVAGRCVQELVHGFRPAGRHEVTWLGRSSHGDRMGSGVYLCRLETETYVATTRVTLLE
jgi:hypothetical protein